jgi:DNA-binding transcriptional LysR family regulator
MELRHLRSFLALADELHFGRAAERVNIAQPALSRHIQQLESDIGVALVKRSSREVKLTPAGVVLRDRMRSQLDGITSAVAETRAVGAGWRGQLCVGFITNMSYVLLPRVLERLRQEVPDAIFNLREASVDDAERGVCEDRFDLALTRLPINDQSLMQRVLHQERLMLALPKGHRLAERSELAFTDVAEEPFVMCRRHYRAPPQHLILQLCEEAGFRPRVVQEVEGKTLMMELVAGGMGLTVVPESSSYSGHEGLIYRPIRDVVAPIHIVAIWRSENRNPLRSIFLRAALEVAAAIAKAREEGDRYRTESWRKQNNASAAR